MSKDEAKGGFTKVGYYSQQGKDFVLFSQEAGSLAKTFTSLKGLQQYAEKRGIRARPSKAAV